MKGNRSPCSTATWRHNMVRLSVVVFSDKVHKRIQSKTPLMSLSPDPYVATGWHILPELFHGWMLEMKNSRSFGHCTDHAKFSLTNTWFNVLDNISQNKLSDINQYYGLQDIGCRHSFRLWLPMGYLPRKRNWWKSKLQKRVWAWW